MPRTLITGGAGFLGSHLCERFLAEGHEVVCVDNLITGSAGNVAHLVGRPGFTFTKYDVCNYLSVEGPLDYVLHFASPASPRDYLEHPIHTLKVGSLGTHNALGLCRAKKARFLLASTSEVYGDPKVHPQDETYWGNVNPIGIRGVYDEAKRFAEAMTMAYHRAHSIDTRIVRIFNSILADESVVVFNDETMHLEPIEEYAERVRMAPGRPRRVLVPAFDPVTFEVRLRAASALIKHPAHQDAFELKLRYGRSVKVTGDHSVFVRDADGRPIARPVREVKVGDHVAIPARLPVVERDRTEIDLAAEFARAFADGPWDWAVRDDAVPDLIAARRDEIHRILERSGRFDESKRRANTISCKTKKWMRTRVLPLAVVRELGFEPGPHAELGPYRGPGRFLPNRIELADEVLWLLGFYLAEGCAYSGDGTHFITFSSDQVYLERAKRILEGRFRVHAALVPPMPGRAPSVYVHSKPLHRLFATVLGLGARRIPPWIMQLPLSRAKHFLEGYRCGDGTHSGKTLGKKLEFSTVDRDLATDLNYLLLRFGVVASLGRYETTFKQRYGERKFPFYRLTVCALDTYDILSWDEGVKQRLNAARLGDLVWASVKSVEPCVLTGHVFDFSVPGAENFIAGTGVHAHNTYGPRMRLRDGRALPEFMGQGLRGEPITVYGDGSQTRSFTYVDDLVEGIFRLLHSSEVEPVNIGNPEEVTILEFAKEIRDLTGAKTEIVFKPLPRDDPQQRKPDITKARRVLGWEPRVLRRDGLARTLAYFQARVADERREGKT